MNSVFLSFKAHKVLSDYLTLHGHSVVFVQDHPELGPAISSHPDLMMCKMGPLPSSPIVFANPVPKGGYPENASFCAAVLGEYIIHRTDITSPQVLEASSKLGLTKIRVRQGYAKCGTVVVDECSVITSDEGIISALRPYSGIQVLKVRPGFVELPGYAYGFIGGASGRVDNEIVFNGDLTLHPDFRSIMSFIESRNLAVKYFSGLPLTDIGSIIQWKN